MCEYCGCQALATIDELTREHDLVLGMLSEVRAAYAQADRARMAVLARQLSVVLGPHTAVEEDGLFPALAADFPGQIAGLRDEHREVEAVLGEASAGDPADLTWPDRLVAVLAKLREHIFAEQDGVFPAALSTLSTAQWEAAEEVRSRVGTAADLPGHGAPAEISG